MHEGKFGITCVNFNSGATRTCLDSRQVGTCLRLNTEHAKHMEKKSCKKKGCKQGLFSPEGERPLVWIDDVIKLRDQWFGSLFAQGGVGTP